MIDDELSLGSPRLSHRLLFQLAKPHQYRIVELFVLAIAQAALAAAPPWLVSIALDTGIPAARLSSYWPLAIVGISLLMCAAGSALLSWLWQIRAGEIGQLVVFDLRVRLFAKFQQLSVAFHERLSSGRVIARLTTDMESVNFLFGTTLASLLQTMIGLIVTATAMLILDPVLTTLAAIALVPLVLLISWTMPRLKTAFRRERAAVTEMTVQVVESLNGIRPVHAFRRESRNDELFRAHATSARIPGGQIEVIHGIYFPTAELIFSLAVLAIVVVGGIRVSEGAMEVGVLAAFVLYISQFFGPMLGITSVLDALQTALIALAKIAEVIEEKVDVPEPKQPVAIPVKLRGEVKFENVEFTYDKIGPAKSMSSRLEIPDLNLELKSGDVVAVLGTTGAGKSTIAKLVARFYDPTAGRILLDGIDLRDIADTDIRRAIVMLTQDGFLFAGSVADNIRIGRPSASMDEIEAAARAVGADAFIRALPDGYETNVRKRGARLSSGQRQMIAFARAFLADPAVLILDEATAALDIPTERAMQEALHTLLKGRTSIIIAHRLSTVEIADRVVVISNGRIIDDGIPSVLLAEGSGEFSALYRDGHGLAVSKSVETGSALGQIDIQDSSIN